MNAPLLFTLENVLQFFYRHSAETAMSEERVGCAQLASSLVAADPSVLNLIDAENVSMLVSALLIAVSESLSSREESFAM